MKGRLYTHIEHAARNQLRWVRALVVVMAVAALVEEEVVVPQVKYKLDNR